MKSPIIISGPAFDWEEGARALALVGGDDGGPNLFAAACADPGVMKCPGCEEYLWHEGHRVLCPHCNHEMCDGYNDTETVWIDQWVRARKDRGCEACGETVPAGGIYHMHKTLNDGVWCRVDHCERCWAMCQALWRDYGAESIDLRLDCGELWNDPPPAVAQLAFLTAAEMQARAETQYADKRLRRETAP